MPGTRNKFGAPMSNLRSLGSKCIEESTVLVTLLGLLGCPRSHSAPPVVIRRTHSDSAPGQLCPPFPPRYAPTSVCLENTGSGVFKE